MLPEIEYFIDTYADEMISGNAAYFIGAGISIDSNLPGWLDLIKPFADKIGIKDLSGQNMPLIAQYVINENAGNRWPFITAITHKLRRKFSPNAYHEAISKTFLKTIWTTNYDNLLENLFENSSVDVKFTDESIARDVPETQIEVIKMHGCIFNSTVDDLVISQADYDDFFLNRPATVQRLKIDLLRKSFLFIGYGYGDPNIQNIIIQARRLAGKAMRQHYLITKNIEGDREFELWCNNLGRYSIKVIKIEQYSELLKILEDLSLKSRGKSIFITGSHNTKSDEDAKQLGVAIAKNNDFVLNDGQSSGVMRIASNNFIETIIFEKRDIEKRLRFFPNPYAANSNFADSIELMPLLKKWRAPLFLSTHIIIAFDGGMGTMGEIEIALDLGCIVIPFFKDKTFDTWRLLENKIIADRICRFDGNYINRLKCGKISYMDVLILIQKILN